MHVDLVSPEQAVWSGDATFVFARTLDGELGILPGHQPLLGVLVEYPVRIDRTDGSSLTAAVQGGFLSVTADSVTILGESVELAENIDVAAARAEYERTGDAGPDDEEARAANRRAAARLRAAGETL